MESGGDHSSKTNQPLSTNTASAARAKKFKFDTAKQPHQSLTNKFKVKSTRTISSNPDARRRNSEPAPRLEECLISFTLPTDQGTEDSIQSLSGSSSTSSTSSTVSSSSSTSSRPKRVTRKSTSSSSVLEETVYEWGDHDHVLAMITPSYSSLPSSPYQSPRKNSLTESPRNSAPTTPTATDRRSISGFGNVTLSGVESLLSGPTNPDDMLLNNLTSTFMGFELQKSKLHPGPLSISRDRADHGSDLPAYYHPSSILAPTPTLSPSSSTVIQPGDTFQSAPSTNVSSGSLAGGTSPRSH